MSLIIENIDTVNITIDDLGIFLSPSQQYDLTQDEPSAIATSTDLPAAISGGQVTVYDPLDDVTPLSTSDALTAIEATNDTHFRIKGGELNQLDDVNTTGVTSGDYLYFNGSNFVIRDPADVASDISSSGNVDHTDLTNIGTNTHVQIDTHIDSVANPHSTSVVNLTDTNIGSPITEGDSLVFSGGVWGNTNTDQNLWETITADSGSTTANTTTDTLNIVGGSGVTTSITGDTLTISAGGGDNSFGIIEADIGSISSDQPNDTLYLVGGNKITTTATSGSPRTVQIDFGNISIEELDNVTVGSPIDFNSHLRWSGSEWQNISHIIHQHEIHVAKEGSDTTGDGSTTNPYNTIAYAISTITDSSPSTPYVVVIHAGLYLESPFTIPDYVSLMGIGFNAVHLIASNSGSNFISAGSFTHIQHIAIHGPSSASAVYASNQTNFGISNIAFISGDTAVEVDGIGSPVGGRTTFSHCTLSSAVTNGFVATNNAELECSDIECNVSSRGFYAYGPNTVITCQGIVGRENNDLFYADDGGRIFGTGIVSKECTNVLHIGARTSSPIGSPIVDSFIDVVGIQSRDTVTNDVFIEDNDSEIIITGATFDRTKFTFPDGYSNLSITFQDPKDDFQFRTEHHIYGEFVVGRPEFGTNSWFGQGNPTPVGIVVLTTDDTAGGSPLTSDGGNFIDETNVATHRGSGSTFSFQGTGAGHTILVAIDVSDGTEMVKHWGYHAHISQGVVEAVPKSFVIEIWNGTKWREYGVMSVHASEYYRYSNNLFLRSNNIEAVRIGIDDTSTWVPKTINGTYARWSRIRITDTLTSAPEFHHLYVTPTTMEVNRDGTQAFHGKARFRQTVIAAGNIYGESGGVTSVSSEIGSGGIPTGWDHEIGNSHMNNDGDAIYMQFVLPRGVCTSCPMRVRVIYEIPDTGASTNGTIIISLIPLEVENVLIADPSGGIEPIARTLANTAEIDSYAGFSSTHSIENTVTKKLHSVTSSDFVLDDYYEGDVVAVRVELDDDGSGNKDITIWSLEVNAAVWTHGERL